MTKEKIIFDEKYEQERMEIFQKYFSKSFEEQTKEIKALAFELKHQLPELEKLLSKMNTPSIYEDRIYRFYHNSFKVFDLQEYTEEIVQALQALRPEKPLNMLFMSIVSDGTGKTFTLDDNRRWREATAPIVEAFYHALYFLEMAVKYGKTVDPENLMLPSGWAAVLELYDLR